MKNYESERKPERERRKWFEEAERGNKNSLRIV